MSTVLAIVAGILLLIIYIILRIRRRYNAAMNVYMARYTFYLLSRPEQKSVKEEAKQLVLSRGLKIEGYENDIERYGWYALAMNALNIGSKVPDNSNWFKIRNPSKAIKRGDVFLKTVANLLKQNYDIDLNIQ